MKHFVTIPLFISIGIASDWQRFAKNPDWESRIILKLDKKEQRRAKDMPDTPKTGDMNNPLLWGSIGVVTLLGLTMAVVVTRRNRRKF